MRKMREVLAKEFEDKDVVGQDVRDLLEGELALLAKMVIGGQLNKKIDEIAYAAAHPDAGIVINSVPYGHDFVDAAGKRCELKTSVATAAMRKCNFNWPIPRANTEERRRTALIASIKSKVGDGGYAILEVKNGLGATLETYKLDGDFLERYFAEIKLGKADSHNMGCTRCQDCQKFHRLAIIQDASNAWTSGEAIRATIDWKTVARGSIRGRCYNRPHPSKAVTA